MDRKERSTVCLSTAFILAITAIHNVSGLLHCRYTQLGQEYQGNLARTKTGKTCQAWSSQSPQRHSMKANFMPEDSLEDAKNYCRNPDSDEGGPWCFTTDPDDRWDYCNVTFCQECKTTKIGQDYAGSLTWTKTGKTCQLWSSQSPHTHTQTANLMPEDTLEEAVNYCRNPDSGDEGPWCYTTDPDKRWEYCDVDYCRGCKQTPGGQEYQGSLTVTKSGKTCQAWSSQSPQKHSMTAESMPEDTLEDAKNYCRNPDNSSGLWCYTTDPLKRWEYCEVPFCQRCRTTVLGQEYQGTLSKTRSGKTCQAWSSLSPWTTPVSANWMPDGTLALAKNYCRNPDGDTNGPWCYITDPEGKWDYCEVPFCRECKQTKKGIEYQGTLSLTTSGRTCQAWSSSTPHLHYQTADLMPEDSLEEAENYCRNPEGGNGGPWCYTTDLLKRWEYCDVPLCPQCKKTVYGEYYRGSISETASGFTCQAWNSQSPNKHGQNADYMPEDNLDDAKNYCRNPSGDYGGLWCYVMDPVFRYDYCAIGFCNCKATNLGKEYQGDVAITVNGRVCQAWSSQSPHKHNFDISDEFPDDSMDEAANYCRNPLSDDSDGPWCYTSDPNVRWEYCYVPPCYTQSSTMSSTSPTTPISK